MAEILTITLSPTIDVSSEAIVVRPTRKTRTVDVRYSPGGGGINVARVIARLGGDVEAVYLAGGEIGALLDRLLNEEGLRRRHIPIIGQTRIANMVREKSTGLEYRFIPNGPALQAHELEPCIQALSAHRGGYVVASGSLPNGVPADTYGKLANIAAAQGARFILDTSGAALQAALAASKMFMVKPSLGELEYLAGRKLDEHTASDAAAGLVARGAAELVAVTMGADGALLASSTGVLRLPATHVRVRSAVGAGDSFLGAMIWALAQQKTPEQAFRFGVAAGAAAAMTPGTELCKRTDIFELFRNAGGQW
jgi:6-phosphofructokinase 2